MRAVRAEEMEFTSRSAGKAVGSRHGGAVSFVRSVPVSYRAIGDGRKASHGTGAVFDLAGHPKATRAYAWMRELPGGRTRTCAVRHLPPVTGPVDTVRAAIVAEARKKQWRSTICRRSWELF